MAVQEEIIIPEKWPDIPRVGIRFAVRSAYDSLQWTGLGPGESYPDRMGAQTYGRWHSKISDQYHPYPVPQEHGSHQQTRRFALTDTNGTGFEITCERPLAFAARHHHDSDLDAGTTLADLVRKDSIEMHIDAAMRGLGTGACGPDALPEYQVQPGIYQFYWTLKPLA